MIYMILKGINLKMCNHVYDFPPEKHVVKKAKMVWQKDKGRNLAENDFRKVNMLFDYENFTGVSAAYSAFIKDAVIPFMKKRVENFL